MEKYYGHSVEGREKAFWQKLEDHLYQTAELSGKFGSGFGAENPAYATGLLHDLGKYSTAFQHYIEAPGNDTRDRMEKDHASAGAQVLAGKSALAGQICAYAAAGHHSGLLDYLTESGACQENRLKKVVPPWRCAEADRIVSKAGLNDDDLKFLARAGQSQEQRFFSFSLFSRMLFSCLTDADFLDTEAFLSPATFRARPVWPEDILAQMNVRLDAYLSSFKADTEIRKIRAQILKECQTAADLEPGIFTLSVPTGGGKTLSSLSFALRHALKFRKKRIVYVIPYISIIEQTAQTFREVFSGMEPDPVLEVHSDLAEPRDIREDGEADRQAQLRRLSAENFDAPLVVTTSVQFYESLMANRSSRCRKLHNLTDAVVILDEVQKIPPEFLEVILNLFRELSGPYRTTLVLCSATQPAIFKTDYFQIGLPRESRREIIGDPLKLYNAMRRTEVEFLGTLPDTELQIRFEQEQSFLCIVNTRAHAAALFHGRATRRDGDFHLSTWMFPAHRLAVLNTVRERLKNGLPCRLWSTQLVEAGVDVDFPVVFRSLAGSDSIAQAAGRCNREGLRGAGKVYVFRSEHMKSEQFQNMESGTALQLLDSGCDLMTPESIERYFRNFYYASKNSWDKYKIMQDFKFIPPAAVGFNFASAAKNFRLIREDSLPVLIPVGAGQDLADEFRTAFAPDFRLLRRAQRYCVPVRRDKVEEMERAGNLEILLELGLGILLHPEIYYDPDSGLDWKEQEINFSCNYI